MYTFAKLPNSLFYGDESIYKITKNYKVLLVLEFLIYNTTKKEVIKFTIENMIKECGYKVDCHKGKTFEQFKSILSILQENKIISCEENICDCKLKDLIICTIDIDLEDKFTMLEEKERDIILNYKIQKLDNTKLLFYFGYLKSRMYRRSKEERDVSCSGGRAETCFPSFKTINSDIDVTDDTINKYNDILIELDLIRVGNTGHWYYKDDPTKSIKDGVNIYTLYNGHEDSTQKEIKETIKLYKQMEINGNKVFTENKKYKNNDKKINGFIGRIKYLEKNGKATQEQIEKMNNYIELNSNKNEDMFRIKSLLEQYPNIRLSNIYFILNKEKKYEYYEEVETELGLYDIDTEEFLVEKEYYDWVICNYSDDKKEFFINVVKKHKKENQNLKKDISDDIFDEQEFLDRCLGSYSISDEYMEVENYIKYSYMLESVNA